MVLLLYTSDGDRLNIVFDNLGGGNGKVDLPNVNITWCLALAGN